MSQTKKRRRGRVNVGSFCNKILIPELRKYFDEDDLLRNLKFVMNHMTDRENFTPLMRKIVTDRYLKQMSWPDIADHIAPERSTGFFYYWAKRSIEYINKEFNHILLTSPIQAYILELKTIDQAHEILYNALQNGDFDIMDFMKAHYAYTKGDKGVGYAKLYRQKSHQEIAFYEYSCRVYEELAEKVEADLEAYPESYIFLTTMIARNGTDADALFEMVREELHGNQNYGDHVARI